MRAAGRMERSGSLRYTPRASRVRVDEERMEKEPSGAVQDGPDAKRRDPERLAEYQKLWFALAKRPWNSMVLVPADPDGSAASIGTSLAEIGTRLSELPVRAISVSSLEYDSALALVDLQQYVHRAQRGEVDRSPLIHVTATPVAPEGPPSGEPRPAATPDPVDALAPAPAARLVIAIPPLVSEPLGLAATQSADAIVLTIELGRTRMADAERTIELIGRERIAGCFIVR